METTCNPRTLDIDVVIVNWNAGVVLHRCLYSLLRSGTARPASVVVVDNGSPEEFAEALSDEFPEVFVHQPGVNLGFGVACNEGAGIGCASKILFLNPDTILNANTLELAIKCSEQAPQDAKITGGLLFDEYGGEAVSAARFPTPESMVAQSLGLSECLPRLFRRTAMQHHDFPAPRYVDQVIGAFLLIHRDVFQEIGGFDGRFFLYYEEVDLSRRIALKGYRSWVDPRIQARHIGQVSSKQALGLRLGYELTSRVVYAQRYFSLVGFGSVFLSAILVEPMLRLVKVMTASEGAPRQVFEGYGYFLKTMCRWFASGSPRPLNSVMKARTQPWPSTRPEAVARQHVRGNEAERYAARAGDVRHSHGPKRRA